MTRFTLLLTLLAAPPAPAAAETWVVTLVNGAVFETRYPPVERPGREENAGSATLQLMTDVGNWITLDRGIVREIRAEIPGPGRGFGRLLAAHTIELGPSLNDREVSPEAPDDPALALLRHLENPGEPYSVGQFVEPEESLGIPLSYSLGAVPPAGSALRFVTYQDRP